ncbi:hypothetical protein KC867_01855 [Candidatus Saccharibacteria bacterium]|nr:hypothetical protein [Candidatus Saccharibacteria bacterium]
MFYIKNTLKLLVLCLITLIMTTSSVADAAIPAGCPGGPAGPPAPGTVCPESDDKNPPPTNTPTYVENDCEGNIEAGNGSCAILDYLVLAIQVLTSLAGIAIVGSIVYAGIQYSAAGGDSQKVSAAKDRIRNAIIALLFLIFGFAIINYLIPGGALG